MANAEKTFTTKMENVFQFEETRHERHNLLPSLLRKMFTADGGLKMENAFQNERDSTGKFSFESFFCVRLNCV